MKRRQPEPTVAEISAFERRILVRDLIAARADLRPEFRAMRRWLRVTDDDTPPKVPDDGEEPDAQAQAERRLVEAELAVAAAGGDPSWPYWRLQSWASE